MLYKYVHVFFQPAVNRFFLNQAHTGHTWFLRIVSVQKFVCVCVCLHVCPPPKLLITSSVLWCDTDHI